MRGQLQILIGVVTLCFGTSVQAATSQPYAKGGRTKEFAVDVERYRRSGEEFRISGHCQSACTMFLALRNACVEPSARLLFHAGQTPEGTRRMINAYNSRLRAYLMARHVMESPEFHTISGQDIISKFGYRACR